MGHARVPRVPAVALTQRLELVDRERSTPAGGGVAASPVRTLDTWLWLPDTRAPAPLVVFAHGLGGHPRKFSRLLGAWCTAGFAVAAPAFPLSSDAAPEAGWNDFENQPSDLGFVTDAVCARLPERVDDTRVAYAGFSMGAITVLAAAFALGDVRPAALVAMSGGVGGYGGHEFRDVPLLVTHALHDPVVPYDAGVHAFEHARPPKMMLTLDADVHHQGVEDEPHASSAIVDAATSAFLEWTLFVSPPALVRLRAAVAAAPAASLREKLR